MSGAAAAGTKGTFRAGTRTGPKLPGGAVKRRRAASCPAALATAGSPYPQNPKPDPNNGRPGIRNGRIRIYSPSIALRISSSEESTRSTMANNSSGLNGFCSEATALRIARWIPCRPLITMTGISLYSGIMVILR